MASNKLNFNYFKSIKTVIFVLTAFVIAMFASINVAVANEVQVVDVKAEKQRSGWVFHVTLKHADTGWEHYADAWRVVTNKGKELGTRTLYHPHVGEQPFTRSLRDVKIPSDASEVFVEAHDKEHGWAKQKFKVKIR